MRTDYIQKTTNIAWTCHVMRRGKLEYAGQREGKRGQGRPREAMLNSLASWHREMSV